MKTNKYLILMVLPVAMALASCGKKVADVTASGSVLPATTSSNGNSIIPTPLPTSTPNLGCHPITSYATPFTYSLTGTGNVTRDTTLGVVTADQDLKVQITAGNDVGLNPYTKFGATVTLLRDGSLISASATVLPNTAGVNGPKGGLNVGQKSVIVDFSQWLLSGSHTYAVRVSTVNTNYTYNMYCNETYYWNQCLAQYGYYSCYYNYANLVTSMVNSCKQMQGDIGPVTAGRGWSVSVQIETDNTPCLTP